MPTEKLNPIQLFVEGIKEFADIKDPDIKKSLIKLGDSVSSDSVLADYEPSSDATTAAEDFKVELGEYEARMLAEVEAEEDRQIRVKEEEVEVELEVEDSDDEEVPLLLEDEDS